MGWNISPRVKSILDRAADFEGIAREEALALLGLDPDSRETYAVMETANRLAREQFKGKGEICRDPGPVTTVLSCISAEGFTRPCGISKRGSLRQVVALSVLSPIF